MTLVRITLVLFFVIQLVGCASSAQKQFSAIAAAQRAADDAYAHGDMQAALRGYDTLTKMVPKEPSYWFRLGNVQFKISQPDAAIADYQHAIMLKPDYSEAWYNLGIVQMRLAEAAFVNAAQHAQASDPLGAQSAHLVDGISVLLEPNREGKPGASTSAPTVDKHHAPQGGGS